MTELRLDEAAIQAFIRAPDGPIARRLMVVGEQVKVRTIASLKEGFPRDFLGPYIVKRVREGPVVSVGSARTRTRPHIIMGNPLLVFNWPGPKGPGRVVRFRKVNHPGSDMGPYLTKKLLEALAEVRGV